MACQVSRNVVLKILKNKPFITLRPPSISEFGASVKRHGAHYCTTASEPVADPLKLKISKAMTAYLLTKKEYDEFMKQEQHEYEVGKRHLANMMGRDYETFTEDDVNESIAYLLPSGLYEPKARPMMKPPSELYPHQKAAQFDHTGRPYHYLFYTAKPQFVELLHDCASHLEKLNSYEDQMIQMGKQPDPESVMQLTGSDWVKKEFFERIYAEILIDAEYDRFLAVMETICAHPYAYRIKDFIFKYRVPVANIISSLQLPELESAPDGRQYITIENCRQKTAKGKVKLWYPGTGKVNINNKDIDYFKEWQPRETVCIFLVNRPQNESDEMMR